MKNLLKRKKLSFWLTNSSIRVLSWIFFTRFFGIFLSVKSYGKNTTPLALDAIFVSD